jgi:hypothetical protein
MGVNEMVVKINMEMPKSCFECRMLRVNNALNEWRCYAALPSIRFSFLECPTEKRHNRCPLQEVKE